MCRPKRGTGVSPPGHVPFILPDPSQAAGHDKTEAGGRTAELMQHCTGVTVLWFAATLKEMRTKKLWKTNEGMK